MFFIKAILTYSILLLSELPELRFSYQAIVLIGTYSVDKISTRDPENMKMSI
jgi:hypothetical protein